MGFRAFLQKHSIPSYFVIAFVISWGGTLAVLGPKFLRGQPFQLTDTVLTLLAMLLGPSLSSILLTSMLDGKAGLQGLWSRMRRWRVGLRWYAAALGIFPVVLVAVLLALAGLVSPVFAPAITALGIAYGLLAGYFEEVGWTGFAVPRMQLKYGALTASVILGVLHGIWHIMADFLGSSTTLGTYWFPHFAALWIFGLVAMRILMVWVYNSTGSVLLVQLMHASFTGSLVMLSPTPISPANETYWYVIFAAALFAVVAVILAKYGKGLAQPAISPA